MDINKARGYIKKYVNNRRWSIRNIEWCIINHLANGIEGPGHILEIGSFRFVSTTAFLEAMENNPDLKLTTIDVNYPNIGFKHEPEVEARWTKLTGSSRNIMPSLKNKFDLIFVDGDHKHAGAKADFEDAIKLKTPGGHIIAHDTQAEPLRAVFDEMFGENSFLPGNGVSYGMSIYPEIDLEGIKAKFIP